MKPIGHLDCIGGTVFGRPRYICATITSALTVPEGSRPRNLMKMIQDPRRGFSGVLRWVSIRCAVTYPRCFRLVLLREVLSVDVDSGLALNVADRPISYIFYDASIDLISDLLERHTMSTFNQK